MKRDGFKEYTGTAWTRPGVSVQVTSGRLPKTSDIGVDHYLSDIPEHNLVLKLRSKDITNTNSLGPSDSVYWLDNWNSIDLYFKLELYVNKFEKDCLGVAVS